MIPITEAFEIIDRETPVLATESAVLAEVSGRILAEDIIADSDLPPFDRSQMDGFALRAADTVNAPVELRIVGESAAGCGWHGVIGLGEAVRIMTGAPVPRGADAVQKLELTAELPQRELKQDEPGKIVRILERAEQNKFIAAKGSETVAGTRVFAAGEIISTGMIAAMAAFGYATLKIGRRPRVAILSTGSEIVGIDRKPGPDEIRNSNSPVIAALVREFGGIACEIEPAGDDQEALAAAIVKGLKDADILVITGGVSVGKYDLTKSVLASLGAEIFFERVRLKPGKPAVFGRLGSTLVFGLPGNPVSAIVTFHLFVRRAMLLMQGTAAIGLRPGFAAAAKKVKGAGERDTFLPAVVEIEESGRVSATPLKWLGSSDFIGFAGAEVLIFVPAGKTFETGEVVRTFRI